MDGTIRTTPQQRNAVHSYVASRGVAQLGGAISQTILPLIVVVTLGGSPGEVGGILALTLVVSLVSRIAMAPGVDRHHKQVTLQVCAQLLAAGASCSVPLLWVFGWLSYKTLLVAVLLTVLTQSLVQTCGHATVNKLVSPQDRVAVIGRLNSLSSASDIVGQSAAPALTKVLPAPLIMFVDTALNLMSAILLWPLRRWDVEAAPSTARSDDPGEANSVPACTAVSSPAFLALTRTVLRDRPLWVLWGSAIANSVVAPAVLIYITRTLDVPVTVVGVIFAIGSVGGILGGLVVGRVLTAFSVRDALLGSVAIGLISAVSLLGASEWESALYPLLVLYEFASAFSGTLIVATVFGLLQVNSGSSTVARVLTVASTGLELCGLLGIGLGSLISEAATTRTVVAVSCGMYAVLVVFAVLVLAGQSGRDSSEAPTP